MQTQKAEEYGLKSSQETKTSQDPKHALHLTQTEEPADGQPAHYRRKRRCNDTEGMWKLENRLGTN